MRKLVLAIALTLPLAFATSAQAFPAANPSSAIQGSDHSDVIQVKGGHGHGGWKHGMRRGHNGGRYGMHRSYRAYGWSPRRHVGWRHHGCPPGLRMQGRC
jgi:hypothetical protein